MAREDRKQDCIEILPIDAERVIKILANDIGPAEEKTAKSRGDLSAAWKAIESECNCVKGAAKLYFKLSRMTEEARDDFLRSLYLLMQVGGMGVSQDLVDAMGDDDAPSMPVAKPRSETVENLATVQ